MTIGRARLYFAFSMNKLDFAGRNAIVTGGAQGIGAAIVKRLQASGAKVTSGTSTARRKSTSPIPASIASAREKLSARSTCWSTTPASPA